jgi:hypothetical protein
MAWTRRRTIAVLPPLGDSAGEEVEEGEGHILHQIAARQSTGLLNQPMEPF